MWRKHMLAMVLVIFIIIGCGPRGIRHTATLHNLEGTSNRSVAVAMAPEGPGKWQSVGTGDCPGRDIAGSKGPNPDPAKCTDAVRGQTAVCWGHGCTYKSIPTDSCTGGANPGRMYTCRPAGRNTLDDKPDKFSGVLAGTGGDGQIYRAVWTQLATIRPLQYYTHGNKDFVHFSLDNVPYPTREWGVDKLSWSVSSAQSGVLSGIGGDGRIYSVEWTGNKTLRPLQYYRLGPKIFLHFSLDGKPWPNSDWGVEQSSWSVVCK